MMSRGPGSSWAPTTGLCVLQRCQRWPEWALSVSQTSSLRSRMVLPRCAAAPWARYLPLPYLDAQGISTEVQRLAEDD